MERGEAASNRSTRRREGGEHGGQSGEKMVARHAHSGRGGEARPGGDGGMARSDTHGRERKGDGGFRLAIGTRTRAAGLTLSGVARAPGRRRLCGVARACGSAAAACAPGGDSVLMSGPGVERERLTGGAPRQIYSELKTLQNENSSKQIARR
jgi:hypothetical protein